jgi:hypothetical protein
VALEGSPDEDGELSSLPVYWGEPPPPPTPGDWASLWAAVAELFEPAEDGAPGTPSLVDIVPDQAGLDDGQRRHDVTTFVRMLPLPGPALDAALQRWWAADARRGEVDVRHRLRLERPVFRPDLGGWRLAGRLRRRGRWLPMVLELSPHLSYGTLVHLRPERGVHPSAQYFRLGHRLVGEIGERLLRSAP